MDEQREARDELEALDRDTADEAREQEAERVYWQGLSWAESVTEETARWTR
jgi:hypothetical protein